MPKLSFMGILYRKCEGAFADYWVVLCFTNLGEC